MASEVAQSAANAIGQLKKQQRKDARAARLLLHEKLQEISNGTQREITAMKERRRQIEQSIKGVDLLLDRVSAIKSGGPAEIESSLPSLVGDADAAIATIDQYASASGSPSVSAGANRVTITTLPALSGVSPGDALSAGAFPHGGPSTTLSSADISRGALDDLQRALDEQQMGFDGFILASGAGKDGILSANQLHDAFDNAGLGLTRRQASSLVALLNGGSASRGGGGVGGSMLCLFDLWRALERRARVRARAQARLSRGIKVGSVKKKRRRRRRRQLQQSDGIAKYPGAAGAKGWDFGPELGGGKQGGKSPFRLQNLRVGRGGGAVGAKGKERGQRSGAVRQGRRAEEQQQQQQQQQQRWRQQAGHSQENSVGGASNGGSLEGAGGFGGGVTGWGDAGGPGRVPSSRGGDGVRRNGEDDELEAKLEQLAQTAALLEETGRPGEAEPYREEVLALRDRQLGPAHPDTLAAANNLALVLSEQGKLEEAEPLYRGALAGFEKVLGPHHPSTLTLLNNIAMLLRQQQRLDEAEPYLRRAMEGSEHTLGADHQHTLQAVNNLASLLHDNGRLEEAEPLLRQALDSHNKLLGDAHPDTHMLANNLADLLRDLGKLEEAEILMESVLSGLTKILGADHPNTQIARENLEDLQEAMLGQDQDRQGDVKGSEFDIGFSGIEDELPTVQRRPMSAS